MYKQKLIPMNKLHHVKIFIADDHPVIAQGLSCVFEKESNFTVVGSALNSEEMFEALPSSLPTVLLLDLNMPGNDFYENIAWVKKHAPWVKIIIFSGYYSADLVKSLLKRGISGYISKTTEPSGLIEAIHTVMNGKIMVIPPFNSQTDSTTCTQTHELPDNFRKRLSLSRREQEVLELITKGQSSQSIGKSLYISKHTVETHRKNILRKLDFNTSTELVKFAVQQGLV